jgi:hypothetical protein
MTQIFLIASGGIQTGFEINPLKIMKRFANHGVGS